MKLKRILTGVLSAAVAFSSMVMPAFAASANDMTYREFLKVMENNDYNYDFGGATVTVTTGKFCVSSSCADTCSKGYTKATENDAVAQRIQGTNAQYQLFGGMNKDVTIKNVKFVADKTNGAAIHLNNNPGWEGDLTGDFNVELQFVNLGSLTLDNCSFDGINIAPYHSGNGNNSYIDTINNCTIKNVYNAYGVQGIRAGKAVVTNTKFENCTGGVYIANGGVNGVAINGNTFSNMGYNCPADKKDGKGLIQLSAEMPNTASVVIAGNTSDGSTPVLRQLSEITEIITADNKFGETSEITTVSETGSTVAPTQKSAAAKVGNDYYTTLETALSAAKDGDTVTLLDNAELTDSHPVISKDITIDLNQKTLEIKNQTDYDGLCIESNVVMKNGSFKVEAITSGDGVIRVGYFCDNPTSLTLNNVNVSVNNVQGMWNESDEEYVNTGVFVVENPNNVDSHKLIINNCQVSLKDIKGTSGAFYCPQSEKRSLVEINNSTLEVETEKACFFMSDVNINNADIDTKTGRAAFRGAVGSVKNSTVDVTLQEGASCDVVQSLDIVGTLGFENTVVTAPSDIKLFTKSADEVLVAADDKSTFNGDKINALEGVVSKWVTDTDSGFYLYGGTKYGMMRFIFTVNVSASEITESGVKFINPKNSDGGLLVKSTEKKTTFYGDIVKIGEGDLAQGERCYAKAYVTTSAGTYWSEAVPCAMNWNQQFTNYQPTTTTQEVNE